MESRIADIQTRPMATGTNNKKAAPTRIDPWLVVVIIMGVLIVLTLAVFMLAYHLKARRRRAKSHLKEEDEKTGLPYLMKKSLSSVDRHKTEEQEREMMIRKSLAERPSPTDGAEASRVSQTSSHSSSPPTEGPEEHGVQTTTLREDWKAWEAGIQTERKVSTSGGIGLEQHPAFAKHLSNAGPPRPPLPIRGVAQSRLYQPLPKIVVN
ncbi:hypothetical protein F5Y17DRAFT_1290 [Xylariaceae sp. FL0594]|nr:hypothetical protein F5Y17DRAFT_1290 [Xylariaceae sp. FL0594]